MDHRDRSGPAPSGAQRAKRRLAAAAIIGFASIMVVFWTWALFFADPEPVNRIGDQAWTENAQRRCAQTRLELEGLADYTELVDGDQAQIQRRADILATATDLLTSMIDDIDATEPTDDKGRALIPQWIAEYRIYLQDRREFVGRLRATGENLSFEENVTEDGLPISERLATFAADNHMPDCAPPTDTR